MPWARTIAPTRSERGGDRVTCYGAGFRKMTGRGDSLTLAGREASGRVTEDVLERHAVGVVRKGGLEPPRYCYRQPLKLVRLPIPPLPLIGRSNSNREPRTKTWNREPGTWNGVIAAASPALPVAPAPERARSASPARGGRPRPNPGRAGRGCRAAARQA
jgi:hypothetical protein